MLCVETQIKNSKINGIGLFTKQFIPKGIIVWKFTPGFDLKFSIEEIKKFPLNIRIFLDKYTYLSEKSNKFILASDDAKYFNHSNYPNCLSSYNKNEKEVVTTSLRDIKVGEELTDDYSLFEKRFIDVWSD